MTLLDTPTSQLPNSLLTPPAHPPARPPARPPAPAKSSKDKKKSSSDTSAVSDDAPLTRLLEEHDDLEFDPRRADPSTRAEGSGKSQGVKDEKGKSASSNAAASDVLQIQVASMLIIFKFYLGH